MSVSEPISQEAVLTAWEKALTDASIPYLRQEPLSRHTSFHIGGPADLIICPADRAQMVEVLRMRTGLREKLPFCVLGKGSNVLAADTGYRGIILLTDHVRNFVFDHHTFPDGHRELYADCGLSLTALAKVCAGTPASSPSVPSRVLSGLEFAYGIPGSIGGAVVMNAGAFGGEMAQTVIGCDYFDPASGDIRHLNREELHFSYRHSFFTDHPACTVLGARLSLTPADPAEVKAKMEQNAATRRAKQPLEYPSAGSVFKRPATGYMGQMIEESGLKGYAIGDAQVSEKHAGFIVNRGAATSKEVLSLIRHIQATIMERYGFCPEPEIRLLDDGTAPR